MPVPDGRVTTADTGVLHEVGRRLREVAGELDGCTVPLRNTDADLRQGAGQVAHLLADAQDLFLDSWSGVFALCAESCGLVASNLGALVTDLAAVDDTAGTVFRL